MEGLAELFAGTALSHSAYLSRPQTGTVTVELPLSAKNTYSMSLANFGKPIYGGTKRCVRRLGVMGYMPACDFSA